MSDNVTYPGKILLVDDETNIRMGLKAVLQKDGHEVRDVETAVSALNILPAYAAEVVVLDIRMPGMSGTALLTIIKERWPHVAVIMLTGHGTLETAITAVKEGAFDYLLKPAKPATIRQVVAAALAQGRRQREQTAVLDTIQASLQRLNQLEPSPPPAQPPPTQLHVGDVTINRATYEVHRGDDLLALTPAEYQLLLVLAEQAGAVVGYVTLVKSALAYDAELWEAKELIKRHIFTLRQKVQTQPDQPDIILNVRGVGYRLLT